MTDIILLCGLQGSGKSSYASKFSDAIILSNDISGGKKKTLFEFEALLIQKSDKQIIIDNTNLTIESRKDFIDICKKYDRNINVVYLNSSFEECQKKILHRQYEKYQTLFLEGISPDIKDPAIFPIAALFSGRKQLQIPSREEGFLGIKIVCTPSIDFSSYPNKAIFFDIDGTLRYTEHLPNKYPVNPDEVVLYKDADLMKKVIQKYRSEGYMFFGVSNQSGISKGILSDEMCCQCMNRVKELLDFHDIEIKYCPHQSVPISCYCRKPQSGLGMYFIEKYKINPKKSIMVGDMTSDKTFANRLGIDFIHSQKFF